MFNAVNLHNDGTTTAVRIQQNRPFLCVRIDFGGSLSTKTHHVHKPFITILHLVHCLSTKSLYLKVLSSLSTDDLMAVFNKFVSQRGLCSDVYSYNGTNFVCACNDLKKINHFLKNEINSTSNLTCNQKG